ncbi:MAG: FecR domain-containing protein [Pseudomonadota bacterium]
MRDDHDPDSAPLFELDEQRRLFLQRAFASSFILAGGSLLAPLVHAIGGQVPRELPAGRSIYDVRGNVRVDGGKANRETQIKTTSTVETGSNSMVIFRVGKDAHILRENSRIQLASSDNTVAEGLRLLSGALLSVFGERGKASRGYSLSTSTATIGIRGTGVYAESTPDVSYVCTCYGNVDINASQNPQETENIVSTHHDAPRYVLANPENGKRITPAPMKNHTDEELMLVEAIVGRVAPFSSVKGYSTPRRGY